MKALRTLLVVLVLVGPSLASAEDDIFFLGNGQDGFLPVTDREVVNLYMKVESPIAQGAEEIIVDDPTPFGADLRGALVMVLQTAGSELGSGEPVNLGTVASGRLGQWEFAEIRDVDDSGGTRKLYLTRPLVNSYDAVRTQVIYVPQYASVYISGEGRIEAEPWNGFKGGVVAFLVRDTLINDGTISASSVDDPVVGAGFRGAPADDQGLVCTDEDLLHAPRGEGLDVGSYNTTGSINVATAGAGGQCDYAGGGGGGGFGAGGRGGNTDTASGAVARGGEGGAGTTYTHTGIPWRLILGGGGGSGFVGKKPGGTGGGAIFIRTGSLFGEEGRITADGLGANESTDGGGSGGGAGGTIILRVVNRPDCPVLSAVGGNGGNAKKSTANHGPGGGGGGGRIFFQAPDINGRCSGTVTGGLAGASTSGGARWALPGIAGEYTPLNGALTAPGDVTISVLTRGGFVNAKHPTVTVTVQASPLRTACLRFSASPDTCVPLNHSGGGVYSGAPTVDLDDGPHTVYAYAEYQRLKGVERSLTFQVDTTPPNTLPPTGPRSPTNSSSARFVLAASESEVTYQCSLGNSTEPSEVSYAACPQDTTYHGLIQGTHTLWMRAIDRAGNADKTPASYTWVIDQEEPAAPVITAPAASAFIDDATPEIRGTRDTDAEVIIYMDDAPEPVGRSLADGSGNWSFTSSTLEDGPHSVRTVAKDPAGNVSPSSNTVFFTVDTEDPSVSFTYPAKDDRIRDNPLVIRGTTTEPGSSIAITLLKKIAEEDLEPVDGAGGSVPSVPAGSTVGTPGDWHYEIPKAVSRALANGAYVVRARATDDANNSSSDVDHPFILDREPPDTRIVCPTQRFIKTDTVSFSLGTIGEAAQSYDCVLETGVSTKSVPCGEELPLTLNKITEKYEDGTYTLRARAQDVVGNVDPFPAACTWTWDQTRPGPVTIIGSVAPGGVTDSTRAVFDFSASDIGDLSAPVEYVCLLWDPKVPIDPNAEFDDCSDPYPITVPREGEHLLRVRARDQAGNESAEERTHRWTVDSRLPVPVIFRVSGADNPTNAQVAKFRFELTVKDRDPSKIFYSYTDKRTVQDPSQFLPLVGTTLEIETPTEGDYYIQVLALDTVSGLATPRELWDSWSWKVDRTPPDVEIADKPTAWERVQTASFVFSAPGEATVQGFRCTISDCSPVELEPKDCTGVVDGSRASFQVQTGLQEGRNCINVWAVDRAGNPSAAPDSYEWNVDTHAPEPPVITTTHQGELRVATRVPTVEGTAEPYADVAVLLDNPSDSNKPVWVSANEQGRWKALIAQGATDGSHTLRTWAKDRAGNEGRVSEPITLLVDSQSPARVVGGGVGCTSSGSGGSLLALLGLARLLYRGRARRRE